MTESKYNGWTNYETWLYKLWMDNESGTSFYVEIAQEQDMDIYDLSEYLKEEAEEAAESMIDGCNVFSDLLSASISRVNFYEISEAIFEDIEEEPEESELEEVAAG